MESWSVELTDKEYDTLNLAYPKGPKNVQVGARAVGIVRMYFQRKDPHCQFEPKVQGADLRVALSDGSAIDIEVKGTDARDLAWNKLKVSSQRSHDLLENGIPIYRVTDVWGRSPSIYVLFCGKDFTLDPEPRWAAKPIRGLPS